MTLHMFISAQEGIGVVDQPVGTQKHIFRPADTEAKNINFVPHASSCHALPAILEISLQSVTETSRALYKHFLMVVKNLRGKGQLAR